MDVDCCNYSLVIKIYQAACFHYGKNESLTGMRQPARYKSCPNVQLEKGRAFGLYYARVTRVRPT